MFTYIRSYNIYDSIQSRPMYILYINMDLVI